MKVVMIGSSGHSGICIPRAVREDRNFVAAAPGSPGESMDETERRLRAIGYKPAVYRDYREMLLREKPDVAVVDNFYGQHDEVILDAFAAGCHVFSEKPVTVNLEKLERMQEAWRRAGTAFSAMMTYRYDGAFYRAFHLIREGAIGKVRLLNAQKSYKFGTRPDFMLHRETYGGTIPWVGIHAIDWILWMSGGYFVSVNAAQSASEAPNGISPETTALVLFEMNDGMLASLTVDYLNPSTAMSHGDDRIRVVGTEGVLEVRDGAVALTNASGIQYPKNLPADDFFTDFLCQAAGKGHCRISAEEVFASARAAILAQKAADCGEKVAF